MLDPIWSYISNLRNKELILEIIMVIMLGLFIGILSIDVMLDYHDDYNLTTEEARADNHQWTARLRKDDMLTVSCPDGYLISADRNKLIYDGMLVLHCEMMEEEC